MGRDTARSYVGLRLVANVASEHAAAAKSYLQAGYEVTAAEFAISSQTLLSLGEILAKAEAMEDRRTAVVNAGNQLRRLGGMLEAVKGQPIKAFEHVRSVMADLTPLYADGPDESEEKADEKAPGFAGLAETNRERRGHDFYGPELAQAPDLYGSDRVPSEEKTVHARYFHGQSEWFVFETDKKSGEIYGFAVLKGDTQMAEHGYADLEELERLVGDDGSIVERDLQWTPKKFGEVDPRR